MVASHLADESRAVVPYGTGAALDLLTHWGLMERPFEPAWNTRFFHHGRQYEEALSRLEFLAGEQTMLFGMLTGEFGCGKTITRAMFAENLDPRLFEVVTIENSSFSFIILLGLAMRAMGADPNDLGRTKFSRYDRFHRMIHRLNAENRHLVLIFDEAQEMSPATLNELKLLTNLNGGERSLLTVMLVGQPELRELVAKQPALEQRVSLNFHLQPLSLEESDAYLRHRLRVAGHLTGDVFVPEAVQRMFEASKGVPRELNRIAKLALEFAWVNESSAVFLPAVEAVARELSPRLRIVQS
jgi:general secretion pathway protein A